MDFESTRPHIRMTALENLQRINNEMKGIARPGL